ncbi:MAG: formate/nitrite transporter [Streptosporangiaceae bacterium]|nr:formate/nitrite transporter [Streptosporangiaceae bacterium]
MPVPMTDTLMELGATAQAKAADSRRPGRYLVSAMLAGAYIGVAVVLMIAVTGPMQAVSSPWVKLVQGLVFGIALTLVIFAGAELTTGNMMTMPQAVFTKRVGVAAAVVVILFSFVGNLVGSAVFAWLVHEAGVLGVAAAPGKPPAGEKLLAGLIKAKTGETNTALFFRGVLCNFLVCLAVWMGSRTKSDGAKLALIFWCLLAFVSSGFEHVVANMTTFSLGLFEGVPGATIGAFARNLLFVGLGNLVGGALLVGGAYAFIGRPAEQDATAPNEPSPESMAPVHA